MIDAVRCTAWLDGGGPKTCRLGGFSLTSVSASPYSHPIEHLIEEMAWVRRLVKQFLTFTGRTSPDKATRDDLLGGFGITENEAERLLMDPSQAPAPEGLNREQRVVQGA